MLWDSGYVPLVAKLQSALEAFFQIDTSRGVIALAVGNYAHIVKGGRDAAFVAQVAELREALLKKVVGLGIVTLIAELRPPAY